MKLPVLEKGECLCDRCVALCCRYFALEIDKPETARDFDDLRWYLLHEDSQIFVEDGEWYLQINRKCRALLPDNRCGIYHNRPAICRGYNTKSCDWHADAYDYEHMFTEPEQIEAFAKEYLSQKRKRGKVKKGKRTKPKKRAHGARYALAKAPSSNGRRCS